MSIASAANRDSGQPSLRQRTTHGVMWIAVQAGTTRIVGLVQQIALGWLLAKSDFGLIAMTYTVSTFVNLMANPGIDAVLVQRLRRYRHWATPAFWLGTAMGFLGCLTMLALGPLAAWAYGQPTLVSLITVLAVALPIQSLQIVPKAQLQMQMRFRAIVLLGIAGSVLTAILTIAGASFGFGAYSFVVPIPITAAATSAATWWLVRPPVGMHWEVRRWRHLFSNGVAVGGTQLLNTLINQADYIALGLSVLSDSAIGTYFFAFSIAVQPLRLISSNVPVVLFPGLSHLSQDPEKQVRATLKAMRLLMLVTVPVCFLQVLLAEPLFHLVFGSLWNDAILPCQLLTIGLMINAACWPAVSLMLAQGRFREQFVITVLIAILLIAMLGMVVWLMPSIVTVAMTVTLFHFIVSPFLHWMAVRNVAPRGSYLRGIGPPLLAGLAGMLPGYLLQHSLPTTFAGDIFRVTIVCGLFMGIYAAVLWGVVPASVRDLGQQLLPLWHRLRGTGTTLADAAAESTMEAAAEETIAGAVDKMA